MSSFIIFTSLARSGIATVRAAATPVAPEALAAAESAASAAGRNAAAFRAYVSQEADTWEAYASQVKNAESRAYRKRAA